MNTYSLNQPIMYPGLRNTCITDTVNMVIQSAYKKLLINILNQIKACKTDTDQLFM